MYILCRIPGWISLKTLHAGKVRDTGIDTLGLPLRFSNIKRRPPTRFSLFPQKREISKGICCLRSWSMTRWSRTVTEYIHGYGVQFKTKLSVHSPDEKVTCENRRGPSKFDGKLLISHENVSPVTLAPSKYRFIMIEVHVQGHNW